MTRRVFRSNDVMAAKRDHAQQGFSMLEVLIVVAIIGIMGSIALFMYATARKATAQDVSGKQIMDFFRDANTRALTTTNVYRVDITPSTPSTVGTIVMKRVADNRMVRQETLSANSDIVIGRPGSFAAKPPSPFNFADVSFGGGTWSVLFHSDGSATNTAPTPSMISTVIYLYAPNPANNSQPDTPTSIRAISLFGPTGSVRFWGYDGTQFTKR